MSPIKPENEARYPKDWEAIRRAILAREDNKCKFCAAENGKPHPKTGSKVVLTIAHLRDHAPERVELTNLAALCQKCHLKLDRTRHAKRIPTPKPDAPRQGVL
jgi:5-methylcytosine-specific restriction endonuclease McrA